LLVTAGLSLQLLLLLHYQAVVVVVPPESATREAAAAAAAEAMLLSAMATSAAFMGHHMGIWGARLLLIGCLVRSCPGNNQSALSFCSLAFNFRSCPAYKKDTTLFFLQNRPLLCSVCVHTMLPAQAADFIPTFQL